MGARAGCSVEVVKTLGLTCGSYIVDKNILL